MKKLFLGVLAAAAVAVAAPGLASADVSNNGTTNDAHGYGIANHIHNFNDGFHGIGHLRSEMTGAQISGSAGARTPKHITVDTQGDYAPISNNG